MKEYHIENKHTTIKYIKRNVMFIYEYDVKRIYKKIIWKEENKHKVVVVMLDSIE